MSHVTSRDGTTIAYERSGSGPALILVDGALCSRRFGPTAKLTPLLAGGASAGRRFTVYRYDRRGRGESGDTPPYSLAREIEDLAALIERAGGRASLVGLSSGGALAIHASAAGLGIDKVVAYEPPYVNEAESGDGAEHEAQLQRLLASGDHGGAVTYFMRDMVGAPAFVPIVMRLMPWIWRKLKAVAPTLPYDAAVMTGFRIPRGRFTAIDRPVLVLNGTKTDPRLKAAARALAATVPGAQHAELAGQTHNVSSGALTAASLDFLAGAAPVPLRTGMKVG
jgi:pimeloyl-ACP methyl ester carboxylesterase